VPHKYVKEETINRINEKMAVLSSEINRIRSISRKDKDGVEVLLERLKKLVEISRKNKDTALDGLMEDGKPRLMADGSRIAAPLYESRIQERMSLIFRGEEKAFEEVISMLENPEEAVSHLVAERDELSQHLEYLKKMELRASEDEIKST